jgi:2-polyprenyl-6-methoxyphenol hydroxylase-like FAD-dependent oxidoreductase
MKIVCVGGGPAGLYFAISTKLRDAGHDITVLERDPPGATYGWGVVYWDNLLDTLYRNDAESARRLRSASSLWQQQQVRMRNEQTAYLPGYGYSMGRGAMLEVLSDRAAGLGIHVQHHHDVTDIAELADVDLVVAADGANSRVRRLYGDHFDTTIDSGANPYIWLGTDKVFDSFVFGFQKTDAGWIWCHAYPSDSGISTFIIECQQQTWDDLRLGALSSNDGLRLLESIFTDVLDGHPLISGSRDDSAHWLHFTQVRNTSWHHDNVVLLGDAAHTTHFTIGSGTRLAMIDAIALAQNLYDHDTSLPAALSSYQQQRHAPIRRVQAAARSSMAWFENLDRYTDRGAVEFAAAMCGRQGPLPPWRHQMHLATQLAPVRAACRWYETGQRFYRARRRGEPLAPGRAATRRPPCKAADSTPTTNDQGQVVPQSSEPGPGVSVRLTV